MRGYFVLGIIVVAIAAAAGWGWNLVRGGRASDPTVLTEANIDEGGALYGEYCAACHGANLEGQADWRSPGVDGRYPAPPHDETGHTWHHPDSVLFAYTRLGGKATLANQGVEFNSGMPAFGGQLTDQQIRNILGYIKSTWPDRTRQMQAARTEADENKGEK